MVETLTEEQATAREEKAKKAAELRERLRNGRTGTTSTEFNPANPTGNPAGTTPEGNRGSASQSSGADFQTARREVNKLRTVNDRANKAASGSGFRDRNDGRGAEEQPIGQRSGDRRSFQGDSSTYSSSARTGEKHERRIGNMTTDEPDRERKLEPDQPEAFFVREPEEKLLLKYPKAKEILKENSDIPLRKLGSMIGVSPQTAATIKQEYFKIYGTPEVEQPVKEKPEHKIPLPKVTAEKFTDAEAKDKKESLKAALESNFEYLDQYLIARRKASALLRGQKDWDDGEVWSNMDEKELDRLAGVMVRGAKRSPAMAMVVNATIDSADYIAVGVLMGPRMQETVQIMRETRSPRVKRGERR